MKNYFPGANSGGGFFSRFDGIVPPWEKHHYTYVLKGGPGVGKNTLMKAVAERAAAKGYTVEEFHCASDPKGLDAVRIPQLRTVLLDGTSPHSIDPKVPGVYDEIINLGHFKNYLEFATFRLELENLFSENKRHYNAAYAMLGAAAALKKEALDATLKVIDTDKLHKYLTPLLSGAEDGEKRTLFACSATPLGIIDYSDTFLPHGSVIFSEIVGEAALCEAEKLLSGKCAEVFCDFVIPENPHAIVLNGGAIAIGEGGDTLQQFLKAELPAHISFCLTEADRLVASSTEELAKALHIHDKIEEIYRNYVDYGKVNEEREKLLKRLGL